MYPFSIRRSVGLRSNIDHQELHELLIKGVNGRKITRVKKNQYRLEEPRAWFGSSDYGFVHEITIHSNELVILSYLPLAYLIPILFTLVSLGFFIKSGVTDAVWNWGILVIIPIPVFIIMVWSSMPYLFSLNTIKELERRILNL